MINQLLVAILFTFTATAWAETYIVKKGDTLLSIADKSLGTTDKKNPRRYEMAKQIQALNPQLKNPNVLEPGETLTLPGLAESKPVPTPAPVIAAPIPLPPTDLPLTPETAPVAEAPVVAEEPPPAPAEVPAPAIEAAPAPMAPAAHAAAEEKHSEHPDFFFIQARYQMLKFKASDVTTKTESTLESKMSYGFDFQYGKILNEKWHLLAQAGITQTEFGDFKEAGRTINHKKETLKFFGLGAAYELSRSLHLDFMATYADRTFLIPTTATDYELKAHLIPGADLNISWDFYHGDKNIFGISAIGEYIAELKKDNITYKSSVEPLGALYWKSNYGHDSLNYKATLTYKHGHQKTDVSEQYEDLTSLGVGLYF